ncbi:hypothetical protein CBR_g310 [Chara braunii]|uniref:Uncharacterized protein n=1 Tax=Chara braunii TaxID=69332 RepID=A0A388JQ74_CHABU|nr:hypothetical protein CBR_g310 [Chara braunii]|eukprot:GBG59979.1 hypothetical protein CBR_g310 [Chara braunii]
MSPETHICLAEPFPPCARSVRHFNGVTTIHEATTEDFDEDPWMTVVPCRDADIDDWCDGNWATMESRCPWASQYKFANMLEFGNLIPLPNATLTSWCAVRFALSFADSTSSSKGEVEPTGTSVKESRKDSTRRSSTATQGWSNHSRSKWFIDWCCGDASNPTGQPCGPVIFIDDSRRRRVLGAVLRWEDAKGGRRHFYMQKVYGAKGNVVANSKRTLLDLELCEGFGAGAVNTLFYRELVLGGSFVLACEFFDMLEDKNIALDVPCDVNPSLELSLSLKLCSGCQSSGAAAEGGDLGSGPATQLHRGESRGQFDDSEDEGTALSLSDMRRSVLSIPGVQTDAPVQRKSTGPAVQVAAYSEVDLEASEGQGVEEVDEGGLGSQGAPQKRRGDRRDEFAGSTKKLKSKAPRTAGEKRKGTEGEQGRQVAKRPSSRQKQPESGPSSPPTTGTPIDVDAGYFLEYKDGVRTKREFDISPAQVVDLGDWEDLSDAVGVRKQSPILRFTNPEAGVLGLDKPTPGTKAEHLRPEDWRDELAGQYYYNAVCGQHNAAAARSMLGSEVARKYDFERWPGRMVNFSDDDFEGYFLVSSQDNKKDLKAPPRQLKLSMRDIRWQWKRAGCPRAVMGNPIGKQDQVRKWREFCNVALNMTPHNNLWILADQQGDEAIRKQGAALRSYFPLAMAGENVWKLAVKFFEKWETGILLEHDGAKWIMRKKKVKNVKPGVAYIHNDKLGRKEVVYNVPMDPLTKKGKKEKEEGEWFVQVPEPDAHCWKTMESLTDNEKCHVLKKVLACEVFWVQAGSPALAKLGKLSVQEVVNLVKCNRVLVRNESRGLDAELWDGSTKYVTDSSLFKDCPPYMGCDDDRSIEATEKLAGHKKLSVDWRNKVLSVLTGSRLKSREIALAEGIVHIKWNDTGNVTSIAPFGNDPLEADIRSAEVKEAVVATKSHTFVLDLYELVDLKLLKPQAFDTLDSQLQTWCPSHWMLVVFILRQQNLYFLACMNHLSFVKLLEGKWVRSQQKKSFPVGNNLYTEDDRMYILFKGDDLRVNTSIVYEGKLPAGTAAAVRVPQKVTQTDVSDIPFNACDWLHSSPARRGIVYGDMKCNPAQFVQLLESVTKKGEGVVFLGKPHARSVWEVLKAGRHVIAKKGNSELLQFTIDLVKSERDTDAEYVHRKDHMFTLLDNYHDASRMNTKTFLERLQSLCFVESEEELTFDSYSSLISTEDEETTDIEFDATADEEGSDTESLDLQYDQHSAQHATGLSLAGPSTSPASLVSPIAKPAPSTTPMKLLQRMQALASGHRSLRPGSDIPPDHLSWTNANIHFLPEPQSRSTEADWGHDMIKHPGVIQPAIQKGEWIVVVAVPDGGWMPLPRGSKSDFLDIARIAVLQQVRAENGSFAREDVSVISTAGRLFAELQDKCWLELTEDYYDLDTSPSKGRVNWKIPPPCGMHSKREGAEGGPGDRETVKFAGIRTSPGKACGGPGDRETAKFAGIRTSSGKACGGPSDRESAKFVGIRTSSGKGGQPGILVLARGAACGGREAHSSEIDTGSGEVAALHAGEEGRVMDKEKEVEEGDTGEELEEGGDEGEEEEDEGEEGEETKLAGLLGGQEGEKGELDTGDDEQTFSDDDDRSGESSDGFGQLYGEHREEDNDDDDTALGMETEVVTSLSAERDDYEVQAMMSAVDLQHRFNEARVTVSLTKPSVCIDIEEVIDGILGDHHMSAQPSLMPGVDDPLDVKPSGGSVVDFSPTSSPMLPPTIASGGEGGIGGQQDCRPRHLEQQ